MTKTAWACQTLGFKQEAVRLVEGCKRIAAAVRTLGVVEQTLFNSEVQWGQSGFATLEVNRCQPTAGACALLYNGWRVLQGGRLSS